MPQYLSNTRTRVDVWLFMDHDTREEACGALLEPRSISGVLSQPVRQRITQLQNSILRLS